MLSYLSLKFAICVNTVNIALSLTTAGSRQDKQNSAIQDHHHNCESNEGVNTWTIKDDGFSPVLDARDRMIGVPRVHIVSLYVYNTLCLCLYAFLCYLCMCVSNVYVC